MRSQSKDWSQAFGALVRQTGRLWWTLLPKLLLVYVPTWTLTRLLEMGAAAVGTLVESVEYDFEDLDNFDVTTVATWNHWLAVVLVALSFLVTLTGTIICWRIIAAHMQGATGDDAKPTRGLTATLSVTMLGFLGTYSVFDEVDRAANRVLMDSAVLNNGDLLSGVFIPLYPDTVPQTLVVIGVIAGAFVLRRVAEQVGEKRGITVLGLIAAALEAFYLLAAFVLGRRLIGQLRSWLLAREFNLWWEDAVTWATTPFRWLGWSVPDIVDAGWRWFLDAGWPFFVTSLLEPLLWLALAGLALGGQVSTFRGWLEAGRIPGWVARSGGTKLVGQAIAHPGVLATAQDLVFGDLDDKYLPFFQHLRLTWRAGAGFLGAFIVVYAILGAAHDWAEYGLMILVGPMPVAQQMFWQTFAMLFAAAIIETVRLCLLAVAYVLAMSRGASQ